MNRVLLAASVLTASTILVLLWSSWRHHTNKKKARERRIINKVLFFPDQTTSKHVSSLWNDRASDSSSISVKGGEVDQGSLWELLKTLQLAKHSIDVCMLTIASREVSDALIAAHRAGVIVRVVTNDEQMMYSGTQVSRLRQAGIQVRIDESEFRMHHKFAVVDGELLMSGSLNWTTQGLCGNQENVIITSEPNLVWPFLNQFELLWDKYNPSKMLLRNN